MNAAIDEPRPVRDGEQLDVARLRDYLAAHLPARPRTARGRAVPPRSFEPDVPDPCGAKEWVLRRPPFGNRVKTAHDMGREYRILSRLCQVYPPAPAPALYCEDERSSEPRFT